MMRLAEAAVFLSLAAGLHLGVWAVAPRMGGLTGTGDADSNQLALRAAAPAHAELARAWEAAPSLSAALDAPPPPVATPAPSRPTPQRPGPALPPTPNLAPVLPAAMPVAAPEPDRAPAMPPPASPAQPEPGAAPESPPRMARPDAPARAQAAPQRPVEALADAAATQTTPPVRPRARPERAATPTAKAKPPSEPQSGASASRQAGRQGKDSAHSAESGASAALQAGWGAKIQSRVHRQMIYPRGATGSGSASVILTVDRNGKLAALRLTRSSGTPAFDEAALRAVRKAGRFPAAPDGLTRASYSFTLSLAFRP